MWLKWDVVIVQSLSCAQLFAIQWTEALQASLSFTISQSLLKFTSIESVMLSNHFILCCLLLHPQSFPDSRFFPVGKKPWPPSHQVAKVLELQLQHSPSNEYLGLISFRIDYCFSLQSKGLSGVFPAPEFERIKITKVEEVKNFQG